MGFNKKFFTTGGIVASTPPAAAGLDPLQNFETVTYTGNGGTQKITGYIRKGGAFNGSSSDIDLPSGIQSSTMAVSMFVYFNSTPDTDVLIEFENGYGINFLSSDSGYVLAQYANSSGSNVKSNSAITTGQWYHIAANFTSSSAELYIDKTQQTGGTVGNYVTSDQNTIGSRRADAFIPAKIDQVRIFNTTLNQTQIDQLADEDYSKATKSTTDIFGNGSGVALYQLDEDATDTGRDFGQSAVFNGSSSYIDIPHNTEFDAIGGLSISLWINKAVLDSSNDRIMDKANGGSGSYGWEMMYNSTNGYRLDVYDTSNSVSSATSGSSGISATGIWDHVVGTISSSGVVKLYVNGVLKDTTSALSGTISTNTGSVTIGRYYNAAGGCNAKFDQIRFFNTDIDQAAVDALYAEYNISTINLIAHYKLDGDATDEQESYDGAASNVTYSDGVKFDGTATNVDFLGMAFSPDLVVIKNRETAGYEFTWFDSIRGALQRLRSDSVSGSLGEDTKLGSLTSFDTNGFSLGNYAGTNQSAKGHVAWCWKAGGAAVSGTGTSGITNVEVSANTAAGFSIVKYNGGGTAGGTVTHGLDSAPELIIVKRTDTSGDWIVGSDYLTSWGHILQLNLSDAEASYAGFNSTSPSSSVFTLGSNNPVNNSSGSYIALCFHSVDSYQRIGTYTGASGLRVYTTDDGTSTGNGGFQPRFLMVKKTTSANWVVIDSVRVNGIYEDILFPNTTDAEAAGNYDELTFNSDGFTWNQTENTKNAIGGEYIYLAIA